MLKEYRLRASPSTPDPTEEGRYIEKQKGQSGNEEKEQPQILCSQRESEQVEAPFNDVQKDGRISVNGYPREQHVHTNQEEGGNTPPPGVAAFYICWMNDKP